MVWVISLIVTYSPIEHVLYPEAHWCQPHLGQRHKSVHVVDILNKAGRCCDWAESHTFLVWRWMKDGNQKSHGRNLRAALHQAVNARPFSPDIGKILSVMRQGYRWTLPGQHTDQIRDGQTLFTGPAVTSWNMPFHHTSRSRDDTWVSSSSPLRNLFFLMFSLLHEVEGLFMTRSRPRAFGCLFSAPSCPEVQVSETSLGSRLYSLPSIEGWGLKEHARFHRGWFTQYLKDTQHWYPYPVACFLIINVDQSLLSDPRAPTFILSQGMIFNVKYMDLRYTFFDIAVSSLPTLVGNTARGSKESLNSVHKLRYRHDPVYNQPKRFRNAGYSTCTTYNWPS